VGLTRRFIAVVLFLLLVITRRRASHWSLFTADFLSVYELKRAVGTISFH
jgi:hypothetical protein